MEIRFTLLSDGPSDRALEPIIRWTLRQHANSEANINGDWANLKGLARKVQGLAERMEQALELFPCDVLFVHRDAEREEPARRFAEVERAIEEVFTPEGLSVLTVVPVRMTEAWLLFDEDAIRSASHNPNGRNDLDLPVLARAESLPDPKEILYEAIRKASGKNKRALKKLNLHHARTRVSEFIDDFSPLRRLSSFRQFEDDVEKLCHERWPRE